MRRARRHLTRLSKAKFLLNDNSDGTQQEQPGETFGVGGPNQIRQLFQALNSLSSCHIAIGERGSFTGVDLLQILKEMHLVFE